MDVRREIYEHPGLQPTDQLDVHLHSTLILMDTLTDQVLLFCTLYVRVCLI